MHLLFVSSELLPYGSTGVPGEMVAELARAHREDGVPLDVVTLLHPDIAPEHHALARRLRTLEVRFGEQVEQVAVLEGTLPGSDARVFFLDHPLLKEPDGAAGARRCDPRRAHLLAAGALQLVDGFLEEPDVLHAVGWESGLTPLLLNRRRPEAFAGVTSVFTVTDAAELGLFAPGAFAELGYGQQLFTPDGMEFHEQASLLKAGLISADWITVPGPTSAEALRQEPWGCGLHGLYDLLAGHTTGVLAGANAAAVNPATDDRLPARFSLEDPRGKAACKAAAQRELGLIGDPRVPLVVVLGPVVDSPGTDAIVDAAERWSALSLQLGVAGTCAPERAQRLAALAAAHPGRVAFSGEAPSRAARRLLLAGADAVLIPGTQEAVDLVLFRALRYGTAPVVRSVGALRDAVVEFDAFSGTGTGFTFDGMDGDALLAALHRLLSAHAEPARWGTLVGNAMRQQYTWKRAARRYRELYERATARG